MFYATTAILYLQTQHQNFMKQGDTAYFLQSETVPKMGT